MVENIKKSFYNFINQHSPSINLVVSAARDKEKLGFISLLVAEYLIKNIQIHILYISNCSENRYNIKVQYKTTANII